MNNNPNAGHKPGHSDPNPDKGQDSVSNRDKNQGNDNGQHGRKRNADTSHSLPR